MINKSLIKTSKSRKEKVFGSEQSSDVGGNLSFTRDLQNLAKNFLSQNKLPKMILRPLFALFLLANIS
jgi:hypothetical protein